MKGNNTGGKQLGINMVANIVSYSANILISFVLTPFLINTLGKETYSFYPLANQIVSYLSILTNAMNSMASRFVTVELVRGNKEKANGYYASALVANLLMGLVLMIPMQLIIVYMDKFMDIPINAVAAVKMLFALVFSSALLRIISSIFGIATFAKNRIDLRSIRELVTAVLRLILYVILYRFMPPSIVYVGVVTLLVAMINIAFQVFYSKKLMPEIRISRRYIKRQYTMEMMTSSSWNAINTFGNMLLTGTSMIMANMFYGAVASGSYSIVQTVPQFINGVISMLVGVFYPVITYRYAQNDKAGLVQEIRKAQNFVGLFGCATITVFSAMATEFFGLWTPGEDAQYLALLSFLTIAPHFVISCMWTLTNVNIVMNKVKVSAYFTLGCGVANIVIAYMIYGLTDIGLVSLPIISTVVQLIRVGIFMPLYVSRNLQIKWNTFYQALSRALVCSVPVFVVVYSAKQFFSLNSWLRFIMFGGFSGIFTLIVFAFGMLGYKQSMSLVKRLLVKIGMAK